MFSDRFEKRVELARHVLQEMTDHVSDKIDNALLGRTRFWNTNSSIKSAPTDIQPNAILDRKYYRLCRHKMFPHNGDDLMYCSDCRPAK